MPNENDEVFFESIKKIPERAWTSSRWEKLVQTLKNALLLNNKERFEQIAINLERLRWEKRRPAKYVYVNLPSYKLRVIDKTHD